RCWLNGGPGHDPELTADDGGAAVRHRAQYRRVERLHRQQDLSARHCRHHHAHRRRDAVPPPCLHLGGTREEPERKAGNAMSAPRFARRQQGATLVVVLVMLAVLTLFAVAVINLSNL